LIATCFLTNRQERYTSIAHPNFRSAPGDLVPPSASCAVVEPFVEAAWRERGSVTVTAANAAHKKSCYIAFITEQNLLVRIGDVFVVIRRPLVALGDFVLQFEMKPK
jgi:hypothetical protein